MVHFFSFRCARPSFLVLIVAAALLAGCGSSPKKSGSKPWSVSSQGGYYKDDGPPQDIPPGLMELPDPLPQVEPFASGANKPYVIFGKRYVPDTSNRPYRVRGKASWYGKKFHGARTSNGEIYDMFGMTAAHTTLPLPSYARVTRADTGQSVIVRVNDRGPFHPDRVIDLSYTAALKLDIIRHGHADVIVERLLPDEIARIRQQRGGNTTAVASAPAPAGQASGLYLQLGAFSNLDNAQAMISQLRSAALQSSDFRVESTGAMHRVQLGPYPSRAMAEADASQLWNHANIQGIVVER
ncbi:MAG: septal ring lytic transglycosylase RlpA family protein [Pigmentiphaga sp.]|nr:septal ring lytic transglycosylase RlpA family protein [Pigmentiphaga sp.]